MFVDIKKNEFFLAFQLVPEYDKTLLLIFVADTRFLRIKEGLSQGELCHLDGEIQRVESRKPRARH